MEPKAEETLYCCRCKNIMTPADMQFHKALKMTRFVICGVGLVPAPNYKPVCHKCATGKPATSQRCPRCGSVHLEPCGRGGKRCIECGNTFGAD